MSELAVNWIDVVALALSILAIFLSAFTFWYTSLRIGKVAMTRPTLVGLGFSDGASKNQVFVRCMLFSTGSRETVLQDMYARVRSGERVQNFSVWVQGEPNDMRRGAGLVVGRSGLAQNFHFLLRKDEPNFQITPGDYVIEIFGRALNYSSERKLCEARVSVSRELLEKGSDVGIQFDWAPDTKAYVGNVAPRDLPNPIKIMEIIKGLSEVQRTPIGNEKS